MRTCNSRLLLVLLLIGWESGASFVNQSQSIVLNWKPLNVVTCLTGLKGHPLLRVQRAGVDYGLRLSLSVQQDQYYGSLRDSSGFKVMVHDQEEPPLINELGFAIQPGTHTFCGLRKEVVSNTRVCSWIGNISRQRINTKPWHSL